MILRRPQQEVDERTLAIREDFRHKWNLDELREQLFSEQEGVCSICGKPMQDSSSVVCAVDHGVSVNTVAHWGWGIQYACDVVNAKGNLYAAHAACNTVKREEDLEEFVELVQSGEVALGEVPTLTAERIEVLRQQMLERCRKGGRIQGRKNVESGQLASIQSLAGRIGGRIAVESGHLASIRVLGGRAQGRKNVESGQLASIQSLGARIGGRIGGRISGRKAVESGQLASIRTSESCSKGGRIQGRKNVESGHLTTARHKRWHVNRGISNPDCALCVSA
jgi:hypothetical protein